MPRIALCLTATAAAFAMFATQAHAAQAWSGYRTITGLYPTSQGLTFYLDGARINVGSPCEANRMRLLSTSPNYDVIASVIVTAYALGHQVTVNYDTTTITACDTEINRLVTQKP